MKYIKKTHVKLQSGEKTKNLKVNANFTEELPKTTIPSGTGIHPGRSSRIKRNRIKVKRLN